MPALRWLSALFLLSLAACSPVTVQDYAGEQPALVPERFFNGQLVAHGVIKDRAGEVTRRFVADIDASWENGVGTLDESFTFNDGSTDTRTWTLRPAGDGRYVGTAGDVVGPGELTLAGNALFLDYVLRVPWRDGSIDLRIDDRMYLVDEQTLINESVMYKFGFRVGEILLVIRRLEP
ncbi:MAG: hypothetical protein CME38_08695 [Haliea sp.]|nr:hypothetical protein [Haliea sp.]